MVMRINKNKIYALTLILFTVTYGQINTGEVRTIDLSTISEVNAGNSYITFGGGLGNSKPLWFEGNIIPNFFLRQSDDSRLMGVITPQIIIRMYQEESLPVRTPSYMPQLTMYYLLSDQKNTDRLCVYGRLAHHSNGQEGNFYLENGNININSGNFSTNYYEVGLIKTLFDPNLNAVQFIRTSFEIHPPKLTDKELEGKYSLYRWHNVFSIFKLSDDKKMINKKKANISIKGEATWMYGQVNTWNDVSLQRLNLSVTLFYHPDFLEDVGLFVQIYHGNDYYNINFSQKLDIIRFGIMTEKLRL
jgi:hypothetical protein